MVGDSRQDAYVCLLDMAMKQGYVTFDDVMGAVEQWLLSLNEVDWLSNSIST